MIKNKCLIAVINIATVVNSFVFPIIYYIKRCNGTRMLNMYPYRSYIFLGLCGLTTTYTGAIVAGHYKYKSYILYNIIMLYINLVISK